MTVLPRTRVYLSRNLGSIVADKQTKVKPKPAFLTKLVLINPTKLVIHKVIHNYLIKSIINWITPTPLQSNYELSSHLIMIVYTILSVQEYGSPYRLGEPKAMVDCLFKLHK